MGCFLELSHNPVFRDGWLVPMVPGIASPGSNAYETAIKMLEINRRFCTLVFLPGRSRYNAATDYYNAQMRGAL